jgi:tRNA-dihydrouridine synthase B
MQLGPYSIDTPLFLAPMAGISDAPFRALCQSLGADVTVSEMVTSQAELANSTKTQNRLHFIDDGLRIVQIVGSDPQQMAEAAQSNVQAGAQVIDINMGCPAKKVCKKAAGSALLKDPSLVQDILKAVVNSVDVPVTLKIRTGWDEDNRNGVQIAELAQESGISLLTVHGRTRACRFNGHAEYKTIRDIKNAISIPVVANGDIDSAQKALEVQSFTGADGIMIGRGATGNPWIFAEVKAAMTGQSHEEPSVEEKIATVKNHVKALHQFYGEYMGVRISRKHFSWYIKNIQLEDSIRASFMAESTPSGQLTLIDRLTDFCLKAA